MKATSRGISSVFSAILLAAVCLLAVRPVDAATPGQATVKRVVGTATYTEGQAGGPLREGAVLTQGATITTGAASYVDLHLGANGDALRVEANATLALSKLDFTRIPGETVVNTELTLTRGQVVANVVNKLSKASRYDIKTPTGVAGIRGTCLSASTTRIQVLTGQVQFIPLAGGGVQLVISGFVLSVGGGQPVRAAAVETSGLAQSATALTANAAAQLITQTVQAFTSALAAEAAVDAQAAGGNAGQTAAQVAQTVTAQLLAVVQQAAANAPPALQAAIQQGLQQVQQQSAAIQANAAANAAGIATVIGGGTPQQAQAAAQQAALQASGGNQAVATAAANQATGTINQATQIRNAGGNSANILNVVQDVPPTPVAGAAPGTTTTVNTTVGETRTFTTPGAP